METDFGQYLVTVEERDIDLLLMEEFHVTPEFVTWFCRQVGIKNAIFDGAWHSVTDADGESDLLLRVRCDGSRKAVLIENKVAAPEQVEQDVRYHIRGVRSREAGRFDDYVTCICAPSVYLAGLSSESRYDHRVSYESIRDWYQSQSGKRAEWRGQIMAEAIEQGRRGYTMVVNTSKSSFHLQYWKYLQRKHPRLIMRKPTAKGRKSDWMMLKTSDMPKGVHIIHKNDQGCVDLSFERTKVEDLLDTKIDWPDGITPGQREGSAVLRIEVPTLDMMLGVAEQEPTIEETLAGAYRLIPYCRVLEKKSS